MTQGHYPPMGISLPIFNNPLSENIKVSPPFLHNVDLYSIWFSCYIQLPDYT
uniref:Uncharacterized protein n=1 Tax=Rhizophora mucronata TaxID=61149 RepID=A0A2P2K732_RHIMU